jgi:hypothetical protein
MGTALLLGIPSGYVKTAKSALAKNTTLFRDWSIKFVPSPRSEAAISARLVEQAKEIADQHEDAHIFGFSAQNDRQCFADQVKPYFRFRWFDHNLLKCLGSPDPSPFVQALVLDLAEESEWTAHIKPSDLSSPLLLPECSFESRGNHLDLWRHASAYGDAQNIVSAEKAIHRFRNTYHRKVNLKTFSAYKWVDERDRIYGQDGERHGVAPFPRGWKYSYRIERGFHFDVTQIDGRRFALFDARGQSHHVSAGAYLNVDPHGYVRA